MEEFGFIGLWLDDYRIIQRLVATIQIEQSDRPSETGNSHPNQE
jgi:hypothetical protein